jgi:protein gp37
MAETSTIEWTDATWSPWEGCTKVSTAAAGGGGCDNCYAEAMNRWLRKGANWGPGAPRLEYSDEHWAKPLKWNAKAQAAGKRMRVFPSVCDPFDNEIDPARRARFFALIRATPHLDWLLLTKRIGNAKSMLPADWGDGYPNVWLGATIVNREELLRDGPKLASIPARVKFWSAEPLLGDLGAVPAELMPDWVIAGGESGPKARPAHPDWFRGLRDQCAAAASESRAAGGRAQRRRAGRTMTSR